MRTLPAERCDTCGKYRRGADLIEYEHRELDILGGLRETWTLECVYCRGVHAKQ